MSASIESRKARMLKAGTFHFDSGRDNLQNLKAARELEREGWIRITEHQFAQHAVYQCEVLP